MGLLLAAVEPAGPDRWRWLLTDEDTGATLADHAVALDRRAAEWAGFTDLHGWVRVNADPDPARRIASGTALVDRVGRWIAAILLGEPVVASIAAEAPSTVRVEVPDELGYLRLRPLELAHHDGRPLAAGGEVSFVYQLGETVADRRHGLAARVERGRLRMVAVFSQPDRTSMLALRRERYELTRLVRQLAATTRRAIDLEVLQYGVTQEILAQRVAADGGCDLLHISAHGGSDMLLLEKPDGTPDPISSEQLTRLLRPVRGRTKLAVVSACESAAATVTETLHWLNIDTGADATNGAPAADSGTAMARRIGLDLGCAVVAMRYPVVDDFAIDLANRLYRNMFQLRLPVHAATRKAVADAVDPGPSPVRPPVSIATPVLLTPSPDLAAVVFDPPVRDIDLSDPRLVGFPDEPERFVGRATAMARAAAALAPNSRSTGVLFHGMAGAGKTACALELAYRHRDAFAEAVFWQAPLQPDLWAGALTGFALTLEQRLGRFGFAMIDKIGSTERFDSFLPVLRRMLAEAGLLLVLDNLETLLTHAGTWRDPRWAGLVDVLTGHGGESRVVLTSRTRPSGLDPRVVVLPVHALSRDETILLARELPHLNHLLHADGSNERTTTAVTAEQVEHDRNLVRRTLTLVQGHPKLLELADAAAEHPDHLTAHLDAAEAVADTGRLAAFLSQGDSSLDPDGFLTILTGWTTSTLATLPAPATLLLQVLCTIEDDDRISPIVDSVWPALWRQPNPDTDPPDLHHTIGPLAAAALIHPEPQPGGDGGRPVVRYRIHPGIADTVHAATADEVATRTRQALAGFWYTLYSGAIDGPAGEHTPTVVRAGLAAAPYLLALADYDTAGLLLERAVQRDQTPATAQAVLSHLRRIADATGDAASIAALARVLAGIDPGESEQLLRDTLHRAGADGDHRVATAVADELVDLLQNAGRLAEALDLADTMAEHTRRAGLGPWTQLADEVTRLHVLRGMGHLDRVLTDVLGLRERMAALSAERGDNETVRPWAVRERLLSLGTITANSLERWQTALDLAGEQAASLRRRGASEHDTARARFNTYAALLGLGRADEAEQVLLACQQVFDAEQDVTWLALTLGARADLTVRRGQYHDAVGLVRTAIRLKYVQPDPQDVAASHHNLGLYLIGAGGDQGEAIGHYLAAAVLYHLTGDSHTLTLSLRALASRLRRSPGSPPPRTLAELAAIVERVEGVRYTALVTALTGGDAGVADRAVTHLIETARTSPPPNPDLDRHLATWHPVLDALVAAVGGDAHAARTLTHLLDRYGEHPDWTKLAERLRRIHAGERDPDQLLAGLDEIDTAITRRALDAVAGRASS